MKELIRNSLIAIVLAFVFTATTNPTIISTDVAKVVCLEPGICMGVKKDFLGWGLMYERMTKAEYLLFQQMISGRK